MAPRVTDDDETPPGEGPARVRAFFDIALPAVIALRNELFDRAQGSLSLLVEGAGGWCVRFGDHTSSDAVVEDPSLDADCVAIFTTPSFVTLLDGKRPDDVPVVMGDTSLLERLGQLLIEPAKGGLGARLAAR